MRQRPTTDIGTPLLLATTPLMVLLVIAEFCDGPVIWKARKSRRSWQMLSLHGQISVLHVPAAGASDSKWVQFSLEDSPQFRTTGKKARTYWLKLIKLIFYGIMIRLIVEFCIIIERHNCVTYMCSRLHSHPHKTLSSRHPWLNTPARCSRCHFCLLHHRHHC